MRYISICSGIEAATLAFHPLGWQPLAFAEIEPFPCAVLAHHYRQVPNLGDITKYETWPADLLAECDLLVGGPPCQAFSVAGQRQSLDDARGNLTLTYVKLVNHIDAVRRQHGRPPILTLYENVPGIFSTRDNAFGCLVGALCGQDAPVETETGKWPTAGVFWGEKRRVGYRTLDAQFFGLAQRRRRCFLVAVPNELVERAGDRADPGEILSVADSLCGDSPPRRSAGEKPAPTISSRTQGGGGLGTDFDLDGGLIAASTSGAGFWRDGIGALRGRSQDSHENLVAFSCKDYGADAGYTAPTLRAMGHHGSHANAGGQLAVAFQQNTRDEVRLIGGDGQIAGALAAEPGMKQQNFLAFQTRGSNVDVGEVAGTFGTNADRASGSGPMVQRGMAVRRLTPRECERLQGFPDDFTRVPYRGKPASDCADGPRYRALGNSMAVPVMTWIGRRIDAAMNPQPGLAA